MLCGFAGMRNTNSGVDVNSSSTPMKISEYRNLRRGDIVYKLDERFRLRIPCEVLSKSGLTVRVRPHPLVSQNIETLPHTALFLTPYNEIILHEDTTSHPPTRDSDDRILPEHILPAG